MINFEIGFISDTKSTQTGKLSERNFGAKAFRSNFLVRLRIDRLGSGRRAECRPGGTRPQVSDLLIMNEFMFALSLIQKWTTRYIPKSN